MPEDWVEREPGLAQAGHELGRVLQRARGRPIIVLMLAGLITAGVLVRRVKQRPYYEGTVTVRVEETAFGATRTAMIGGALVDYIWSIALSNETVLRICDDYRLFVELSTKPDLRVGEFRSFFSLEESRNYFLTTRGRQDELRTVRINFHYVDRDPQRAADVALAAANAYIAFEIEQRRTAALNAISALEGVESRARDVVAARQARIAARPYKLGGSSQSPRAFDLVVRRIQEHKRNLELVAAAGGTLGLGMEIAVVDRPLTIRRTAAFWVVSGTVMFAIVLFLTAVGVGAFDSRVVSVRDVERLGFAAVGHIPEFSGQDFGSLQKRLDSAKRE